MDKLIYKVSVLGNEGEKTLFAGKGETLSKVLADGSVHLDMPCGGRGICKKCVVTVSGEACLACRYTVNGDITVTLNSGLPIQNIISGTGLTQKGGSPLYTKWGVSIDIGTTTVCAALISNGEYLTVTRKNPQASMGADVISRIDIALRGGITELKGSIRNALRDMVQELADKKGISPKDIDAAVITGNTTMLYLLTGKNPESLASAPFEADCLFGKFVPESLIGLGISPLSRVYLPRCVQAFIGADITTAVLASGILDTGETALLTDIGTNGELVLMDNGKFYCASTAAGPAFEGAGLSCGTYGVNGAIDRVWEDNGKINVSTIGGAPAAGICGSGVVDAAAVMLKLGIMDETGLLKAPAVFSDGVSITQQDVRQIQLAKGAVRAGIETLIEVSGVCIKKIKTLYIAGGFGNYINLENAAAIGLIPAELLPVARFIGNSAHTGATMLLENGALIEKAERPIKSAKVIALDTSPIFFDNFIKHMQFTPLVSEYPFNQ